MSTVKCSPTWWAPKAGSFFNRAALWGVYFSHWHTVPPPVSYSGKCALGLSHSILLSLPAVVVPTTPQLFPLGSFSCWQMTGCLGWSCFKVTQPSDLLSSPNSGNQGLSQEVSTLSTQYLTAQTQTGPFPHFYSPGSVRVAECMYETSLASPYPIRSCKEHNLYNRNKAIRDTLF